MEFGKFVTEARLKRFKTPRQFFDECQPGCSYFYYTQIEGGKAPDIKIAVSVLKALNADIRKGLYAWTRDQMPDSQTKAMFMEIGGQPQRSGSQTSAEKSLVINRMQKLLLESNPIYWEIVTYLSTYFDYFKPDEKKLASEFKMPVAEMREYLKKLYDHGMINRDSKGHYSTKEWIFVPYEEEFASTRDASFKEAVKKFLKTTDKKKFRSTITRLLTDDQRQELESLVVAFTNSVVDIEEKATVEGTEPCTIGVFCSRRDFGNA